MTAETLTSRNPRTFYKEGSWTGEEDIQGRPKEKQVWVSEPSGSESCHNPIVRLVSSNAPMKFGDISELSTFAQGQLDSESLPTSEPVFSWKAPMDLDQILHESSTAAVSVRHLREHIVSGAVYLVSFVKLAVPINDSLDVSRRLADMKNLHDGWADGIQPANLWGEGYGRAPTAQGLDWLAGTFATRFAEDLPRPHIYPTPEGGVSMEWSIGPYRASLEIDLDAYQAEWHCLDLSTDDSYEQDLQLDMAQSWEWLASEVRRLGDPAA